MASPTPDGRPEPLDLSHHYSRVTKAREASSLKSFYKYFQIPGIGNLAGGLPNAGYFPYDTLEAAVALPTRWKPTPNDPVDPPTAALEATTLADAPASHLLVPKSSGTSDLLRKIDVSTALQYGQAQGYPPLYMFLRQFTREHLHPNVPYKGGPDIILTCGSTDGFSKAIECMSNQWSEETSWLGDREGILCEDFAYMNAVQAVRPRGLNVVPVAIDAEGMCARGRGGLEDVLKNWDYSKGKRPHLMYTVTIGQNPTSGTLSLGRRKEVYALCSKYDVIIIEDDPYWYLQFPSALSQSPAHAYRNPGKSSGYEFLDSLIPSYLNVDTDGRVIRLDTFSKTVAPGCRLGWITAQPAIVERILRITETSTQQPSGFVQSMIAELFMGPASREDPGRGGARDGSGWNMDGWVRWLEGLRGMYERRMNRMCKILREGAFYIAERPQNEDDDNYALISKQPMYSFPTPLGGMFIWLRLHLASHPLADTISGGQPRLAHALWIFLTTRPHLVLVTPGRNFAPTQEIAEDRAWEYFRLCFAAVDDAEVDASSQRFAKAVRAFWDLSEQDIKDLEQSEDEAVARGVGESAAEGLAMMMARGC